MRKIITPVKWEPSDEATTETATTSTSLDSLDYDADDHERYINKKLTKTNWQPATDGRKYEHKLLSKQHKASRHQLQNGATGCFCSYNPSTSFASAGQSLIRHQQSNSRKLLDQLARLRHLNELNYQVKRPEKVARVESLIEQLEKVTNELEEDDRLLDRAELRDLPERFRVIRDQAVSERFNMSETENDNNDGEQLYRNDMLSLEENAIANSHEQIAAPERARSSWLENSTLNRRKPLAKSYYDRLYHDDLAVRRLAMNNSLTSAGGQSVGDNNFSYLLCSNAYTPTMSDNTNNIDNLIDRRIKNDDLHYRSLLARRQKPPHEPPFGIPRQEATPSNHSTASHYLRMATKSQQTNTKPIGACVCCCLHHKQVAKGDSRVSFNFDDGRTSADSGVVIGSPIGMPISSSASSTTPRPSATSRLVQSKSSQSTQSKPNQDNQKQRQNIDNKYAYLNEDVSEEIDLSKELQRIHLNSTLDEIQSACESPTLERYRAEYKPQGVTRRRPRINIENPRAKSPLLKVATNNQSTMETISRQSQKSDGGRATPVKIQCYNDKSTKPTTELECRYDFNGDEDEDEGEMVDWPMQRRIITTDLDNIDSSENNESSIERLNYRGEPFIKEATTTPKSNTSGPIFSIGEYKTLNKYNLKIL